MPRARPSLDNQTSGIRLQKVLSEAGVASRRAAEDLIRQGRVLVNGKRATLGQRVEPSKDKVEVDGSRVQVDLQRKYYLLNKPPGVVTTAKDTHGRATVLDLLEAQERVFPVGRLDMATEGLILLTNDGELAHKLTHPSFQTQKVYVAEVEGTPDAKAISRLTKGIRIGEPRPAKADRAKIIGSSRGRAVIELTIHEGRKHVVRRMMDEIGHPVTKLVRTAFGPLKLGRLSPGNFRELRLEEVNALMESVEKKH